MTQPSPNIVNDGVKSLDVRWPRDAHEQPPTVVNVINAMTDPAGMILTLGFASEPLLPRDPNDGNKTGSVVGIVVDRLFMSRDTSISLAAILIKTLEASGVSIESVIDQIDKLGTSLK